LIKIINNITRGPVRKIVSERQMIYRPAEGWSYAHHSFITFFKGRFYAIWSCGTADEDYFGQRVMIAESDDFANWSQPRVLADPADTSDPNQVYTACGLYSHNGTLHAYIGHYSYDMSDIEANPSKSYIEAHHLGTSVSVMSTTDGTEWSEPRDLGIPIIPNHGPQPTHTGRLIISGGFLFPYSDDPSGVGHYELSGIHGNAFEGRDRIYDDAESIHFVTKQ